MDYVWALTTEEAAWGDPSNDFYVHKTKEGAINELEVLKQSVIKRWEEECPEYEVDHSQDDNYITWCIYDPNHGYENYFEIRIIRINLKD